MKVNIAGLIISRKESNYLGKIILCERLIDEGKLIIK